MMNDGLCYKAKIFSLFDHRNISILRSQLLGLYVSALIGPVICLLDEIRAYRWELSYHTTLSPYLPVAFLQNIWGVDTEFTYLRKDIDL